MTSSKILTKDRKYIGLDREKEKSRNEPFYFIQGADCQFGLTRSRGYRVSADEWPEEIELSEKAIKAINALSPPPLFFIVCGDLCNAYPDREPGIRARQEEDFWRIYGQLNPDIALVCVCGNHDVGDSPTLETVKAYRSSFGDEYFTFWAGGVLCIVINSQLYRDSTHVEGLRKEMDAWLDEKLQRAKENNSRVLVFQHIPFFVKDWDEPDDDYFNVPPIDRVVLMDKLIDAGVTHVFCGHYHRNAGGIYKNLEVVVTSAIGLQLGHDKSGMRIVKVRGDSIEHSYHGLDDFPTSVKL